MTFARARVRPFKSSSPLHWGNERIGRIRPIFLAISERYGRRKRSLDVHWTDKGLDGLMSNVKLFPSTTRSLAAERKLSSSRFSSSSKASLTETSHTAFEQGFVAKGIRKAILSFDPTFFDHETSMIDEYNKQSIYTTDLGKCELLSPSTRSKLTKLDDDSLSEQFNYLITERLASPQILWKLYGNLDNGILRDSLDEKLAKQFCIYLFEHNLIKPALLILLENLPIDQVINTLSNSLIPAYGEDSRDLILGDIIQGFMEMNQLSIAKQLLTELGLTDYESQSLISQIIFISELKQSSSDIASASIFIKNNTINVFGQTMASYYPQLLGQDRLNIWTRLAIYQFMVSCEPGHMKDTFVKKRAVEKFFKRTMNRFIQQIAYEVNTTTDSQSKAMVVSNLSKGLDSIFWDPVKHPLCLYLDVKSLSYLPQVIYNRESFHYVWNSFTLLVRKLEGKHGTRPSNKKDRERELGIQDSRAVSAILENMLLKAIELNLSVECSDVIVYGGGNFNDKTLRDGLLTIVWGKRKMDKYDDNALYCDPNDVDTALLERTINALPRRRTALVLTNVVNKMSRQFPFPTPCPGRILWNLILGIQRSKSIYQFPLRVENNISSLITCRPHLEQLRYMSLSKVTSRGIMFAVEEYVTKLKLAREEQQTPPDTLEREADLKLVLSGLLLLNEKELKGGKKGDRVINGSLTVSNQQNLAKMITNMFKIWDDNESVRVVKLLQQQKVKLSDDVILQCIAMLLGRDHYALALQVLNSIAKVPPEAYHSFLIQSSRGLPKICFRLMSWLKVERHITVPSNVIRKMIIGFCQSPRLNDSESNRRVLSMIHVLKVRGESVTPQVAQEIVTSVIMRAIKKGWGSRRRLEWALNLAEQENVPQTQFNDWHKILDKMKQNRQGYWGVKYYHRPKFL